MSKQATLYRMTLPDHLCPSGLKAYDLLKRNGYDIDDRHLDTREDVEALKTRLDVATTPQVFINDKRIGGYDDLAAFFGKSQEETTYRPVIAIFSVAALLALVVTYLTTGGWLAPATIGTFIAIAMVLLGLQKLQDIEKFSTMFLNYDLLARRYPRYGAIYPFIETGAGLLMLAGVLTWIAAPAALVFGGIGAVSVFKAVYIDKRTLKCACVGGDSRVPLGFVSLTENLMMTGMALWMLFIG